MASNWIDDLTGQRIYDSGIEVQPTVKEWNLKGADVAYNPLTKQIDISVGDGVTSDWKKSARVATTAALAATRIGDTLTANANGSINAAGLDGVVNLALSERILIKDQPTGQDNGIYVLTQIGDAGSPWIMQRAPSANEQGEVTNGMTLYVGEGVSNFESYFVLTSLDPVTLNVTPLVFTVDPLAGAVPAGPAGGQLSGVYPNPSVVGLTETSGPSPMAMGAVANTEVLQRVGGLVQGMSPSGDLGGSWATGAAVVQAVTETSGPTSMTLGAVANGEFLKRVGATLVGSAGGGPPSGAASGDLSGTYPAPVVSALTTTTGPTSLVVGSIADGQSVMRSGSTLIGSPLITIVAVVTTFTTDCTLGSVFQFTMTGGADTLANPTGLQDGSTYVWVIAQNGAGPGTLAYGALFKWPGAAPHVVTAAGGAVDVVSAVCRGGELFAVGNANFS